METVMRFALPFDNAFFNVLFLLVLVYIVYSVGNSLYRIIDNYRQIKECDRELSRLDNEITDIRRKIKDTLRGM